MTSTPKDKTIKTPGGNFEHALVAMRDHQAKAIRPAMMREGWRSVEMSDLNPAGPEFKAINAQGQNHRWTMRYEDIFASDWVVL